MKKLLPALFALLLLSACSVTGQRDDQTLYDLGPFKAVPAVSTSARLPALTVSEITAPAWMDSSRMVYRLQYENPLEAHTYARARWTMSPSRLFLQRLKAGLAHSGTAVLSSGDGAVGLPQLRIEADDFSQVFESDSQSVGRVMVRASVLQDRRLVAQKSFSASVASPSATAGGGVRALANASDAVIADMVVWLNSLQIPR